MLDETVARLRQDALCNTEHPADAVSLLMHAAGMILYPAFGLAGSIALLRGSIDDVETLMVERYGRAAGETAQ